MRKIVFFLTLSVAVAACSSSDDSTTTNASTRPAVGSLYFYTQAILDANGQVDPSSYRTDSV